MKKRIKSTFLLISLLAMIISNVAFASEGMSTTDKREWLSNKGYDNEVIANIADSDIDMIYGRITEQMPDDVVISSESKVWTATFQDEVNPELRGAISTSQLQLKGVVTNFGTSSGDIIGCEVLVLYDWLVTPESCGDDLISLNWDSGYFTLSNFNSHATVKNISTGKTEYFNFITTPHTAQNGGIGWYAKLRNPDISSKIQSNPAGYAITYFEPSRPFKAKDNIVKNFNVMYVHDKCPGITSIGFSAGYGGASVGISVSPSNFADSLAKVLVYKSSDVTEF